MVVTKRNLDNLIPDTPPSLGPCTPCPLTPALVDRCPCGQTHLSHLLETPRASCLDPVPTCGKTCNRLLGCGKPGPGAHRCPEPCHAGPCPGCPLTTPVRCRCGFMEDKELACAKLRKMKEEEMEGEEEEEESEDGEKKR